MKLQGEGQQGRKGTGHLGKLGPGDWEFCKARRSRGLLILLVVPRMELRVCYIQCKCSATELHPWTSFYVSSKMTFIYWFAYLFIMGAACMHHSVPEEIRRRLRVLILFFLRVGPHNGTHVFRLSDKRLHPLSHFIFIFIQGLTRWPRLTLNYRAQTGLEI